MSGHDPTRRARVSVLPALFVSIGRLCTSYTAMQLGATADPCGSEASAVVVGRVKRRPARVLFQGVLLACGLALAAMPSGGRAEQSASSARPFHIGEQALATAMLEFSAQANVDVICSADIVAGKRSNGVSGMLTPAAALEMLLTGTGLDIVTRQDGSFVIVERKRVSDDEIARRSSGTPTAEVLRQRTPAAPAVFDEQELPVNLPQIIVTANKRPALLQDVPLAVTALTGRSLEDMGADQFSDYARTVPGLSFVDEGPSQTKIVIRGVTTSTAPDANPTTSLYFDDIPVSVSGYTPDLRLFDIDRVEVLRGPQGTLYGEASMGGTVRLITTKPDIAALSAKLDVAYSGTHEGGDNIAINTMVNIPLARNELAARFVGYFRSTGGFIDNIALGRNDVNSEEVSGGRLSLRWAPTPRAALTLNVLLQRAAYDGRDDYDFGFRKLVQNRTFLEPLVDDFAVFNLTGELQLGWAALESSASFLTRTVDGRRDLTGQFKIPAFLDDHIFDRKFVQETRLASAGAGRSHWLAGTFFEDQRTGTEQFAQSDAPPPQFSHAAAGPLVLFDAPEAQLQSRQFAVFGEASYELSTRWTVTGGLRWFDIRQSSNTVSGGAIVGLPPGVFVRYRGRAGENGLTPKLVVSGKPRSDMLLYVQAAKGFRQGGPTGLGVPADPQTGEPAPKSYRSDSLWSYELGLKQSWWEQRIVLDAALFYIDWQNVQTTFVRPDGWSFVINADQASSRGVEIELSARPTRGLTLLLSGAYIDARLGKDQAPPNDGLSGQGMPGVPRHSYSAAVRYSMPVSRGSNAFARLDYRFVGSTRNGFRTVPGTTDMPADLQPAYGLADLRAGIQTNRYELSVFVSNATDTRAVLFVNRQLGGVRYQTNRPRTLGVDVRTYF